MMKQDSGISKKRITLKMDGNLTIEKVSDMKEELREALRDAQHIEINIKTAQEVDSAFLQLLCSAHRTSLNMGKTLTIKSIVHATLNKAIENNGYARPCGCKLDLNKTCLWIIK
jgi:ABC-type transporter Mla MlaB component